MDERFEEWWKEEDKDALFNTIFSKRLGKVVAEQAWEAALASQWRPIESNPKVDDEEFFGWDRPNICVCRWNYDFQCFTTENDCGEVQVTPTHWIPIPLPPEAE